MRRMIQVGEPLARVIICVIYGRQCTDLRVAFGGNSETVKGTDVTVSRVQFDGCDGSVDTPATGIGRISSCRTNISSARTVIYSITAVAGTACCGVDIRDTGAIDTNANAIVAITGTTCCGFCVDNASRADPNAKAANVTGASSSAGATRCSGNIHGAFSVVGNAAAAVLILSSAVAPQRGGHIDDAGTGKLNAIAIGNIARASPCGGYIDDAAAVIPNAVAVIGNAAAIGSDGSL